MYVCTLGPLEDVLLKGLGGVTDDVVVHLALAGRNTLQFLSLNSCKEVSGKAAVAVAANCGATLERLDISFCRKIPEAAVTHLTEWCPGMKQVWLWGCTQLTKTFFAGLRPEVDVVGRLA
jgi:DNA repair protein RAD7